MNRTVANWGTLLGMLPNLLASPLAGMSIVLHAHDHYWIHVHAIDPDDDQSRLNRWTTTTTSDHAHHEKRREPTDIARRGSHEHRGDPLKKNGVSLELPDQEFVRGSSIGPSLSLFSNGPHVPLESSMDAGPTTPIFGGSNRARQVTRCAPTGGAIALLLRANHVILI